VGIVDEDDVSIAPNQIKSSSFLDVESVHLEFGNVTLLDVNVSQLCGCRNTSCGLKTS
jgi:hypothetical protein